MEISEQVFAGARKLKRAAVEQLFAEVYPGIIRVAKGLSGREDVAEGVVRFLMIKAGKLLPDWRDSTEAQRWFLHHTVLTARRAAGHAPSPDADLLASGGDPAMKAFVRALRLLPQQQREAVLLHYGEHLNSRYLGVAMDCSADAAEAHLEAGRAGLRAVAGAEVDGMLKRLEAGYARLKPGEGEVPAAARRWATKALQPRRIRRIFWGVASAVLLVAAGWAVWWIKH